MIQDMYQKGNLGPPALSSRSPQTSPNWSIKRKSTKRIKKKNISAPETQSVIHISGAKMIGTKMTIVDNTGLLDPRVRKFLAIAGLDSDQIVQSPEKLAVVEKFANEKNIQQIMEQREERKKKKKEEKTVKVFSPPPPPPPAPPVASSTPTKIPTKLKKTESLTVPERSMNKNTMDWREAITSGSVQLKPIPTQEKENHKKEVQKASDGEILSLLKTALHNINEVSGVSSDEDEHNDDDW